MVENEIEFLETHLVMFLYINSILMISYYIRLKCNLSMVANDIENVELRIYIFNKKIPVKSKCYPRIDGSVRFLFIEYGMNEHVLSLLKSFQL